jgi:hypothetical protein
MLHEMRPLNYSLGLSMALQQILCRALDSVSRMKVVEFTVISFNSE